MRSRAIFVAAGVMALCACRGSRPGPQVDASLEALIPADTLHMAGVRLDRVRTSKLYQSVIGQRQLAQMADFAAQTGVDPHRDIHEFIATSDGVNNLLLIRGSFRIPEIEKKLAEHGSVRGTHGGRNLYSHDQSSVALLSSSIAVAGPTRGVQSAMDRTGSNARMPEPLAKLMATIPSNHDIWAVSLGGLPEMDLPERSNFRNLARAFSAIKTATASADLSAGLQLAIKADYSGEAEAKQVHGALRGLLGLARLSAPRDRPELHGMFDAVQIHLDGSTLKVSGDLPSQSVEAFLRQFHRGDTTVQ